jgi:hypothetical protein
VCAGSHELVLLQTWVCFEKTDSDLEVFVNISFGEVEQMVLVLAALGILKTVLGLDPFKFFPPALQDWIFPRRSQALKKSGVEREEKICGFCPGRFSEWRLRFI